MARVGQKNTKPELALRRLLWGMGYRYRLHDRRLPGSPDIVMAGRHRIVFVHGCFWHSHPGCKKARPPKTKREYWIPKLASNVERDQRAEKQLRDLGWGVLVVWQCELQEPEMLARRIAHFMELTSATGERKLPNRAADARA